MSVPKIYWYFIIQTLVGNVLILVMLHKIDLFLQSCADTKKIKAMRINLYSRYYLGHAIDRPIFRLQAKRWCSVYWHNMLYQAVLILSSIIIYYDICTNHLLYPWDLQTADNFYLLRPGRLLLLYFLLEKIMNTKKCLMGSGMLVSLVDKKLFSFYSWH